VVVGAWARTGAVTKANAKAKATENLNMTVFLNCCGDNGREPERCVLARINMHILLVMKSHA